MSVKGQTLTPSPMTLSYLHTVTHSEPQPSLIAYLQQKHQASMQLCSALGAQNLTSSKPEAAASCSLLTLKCSGLRSLSASIQAGQSTILPWALGYLSDRQPWKIQFASPLLQLLL